jgi:predicted PurR-regulated permease PerM
MFKDYAVKIEKWLLWAILIGIIVLLRHLFPMIFLTFILAYIGNTIITLMGRRFPYRRLNLTVVYIVLIALLLGAGTIIIPRIIGEGRTLARAWIAQDSEHALPPEAGTTITRPIGQPQPIDENILERETRRFVDSTLIQLVGRDTFETYRRSESYNALLNRIEASIAGFIPKIIDGVRVFVNGVVVVGFQFILSIIFSFLILWDLPRLSEGVRSLSEGRTAAAYAEIAPGLHSFGVMLGRAFEAQSLIAVTNAILTSIGFLLLGIPSIALLGTIVFFCSYIPVFGVVLSTLPAALLAFRVGGVTLVFWLVVFILLIHAIEAYGLNPLIYGHRMRMHPVAVLIILLVGEHLFGIWGLLLGVPISAFVFKYVIKGQRVT